MMRSSESIVPTSAARRASADSGQTAARAAYFLPPWHSPNLSHLKKKEIVRKTKIHEKSLGKKEKSTI